MSRLDRFAIMNFAFAATAAALTADIRAAGINLFVASVALSGGWFLHSPPPARGREDADG